MTLSQRWRVTRLLVPLLLLPSLATAQGGDGMINGLGEGRVACESIPPLHYPAAVTDGSLSGTVLVKVFVDEKGRVYDTELVESDLPELFIVEALKTARLSRFSPALSKGRTEPGTMLLPMVFRPRDPDAIAQEVAPAEPDTVLVEATPAPEPPALIPVAVPDPAPAQEAIESGEVVPRILDAGFGKGVLNRELQERGEVFGEGDRVYFWMDLEGLSADQVLTHAWIFRGRAVQEIELVMKGERWRSWSYKTLFPGLEGAWLLELRDESGRLLGSWSFHCE